MNSIKKHSYIYILAGGISFAIFALLTRIWQSDIFAPFSYAGDCLFTQEVIKGIIENGWYFNNPHIGAPFGSNLYGYPVGELFNFLIFKILGMLTGNWILTFNLIHLGTFPAITITTLFIFLKYNIEAKIALVCALLYAFLPYHFFRGPGHLFLSAYYLVPVICWIALSMFERPVFLFPQGNLSWQGLNKKALVWVLVVTALIASSGIYYAFFGILMISFAGVCASLNQKTKLAFVSASFIVGVIGIFVILNLAPNIIYRLTHPKSPQVGRSLGESEIYGLKIAQLLLPRTNHSHPFLARLKNAYNSSAQLVNENDTATLGVIGTIGFLFSLLALVLDKFTQNSLYKRIGLLNVYAVLIASIGGFSIFIALLVTRNIRAYNRISVFIGFLSLLSAALLLNDVYHKYIKTHRMKIFFSVGLLSVLILGIYDQARFDMGNNRHWRDTLKADSKYFLGLESTLGKGAMIFQLPYIPFPESMPVNKMSDYQHFRGYLNTHSVYWSYGAFKGTLADKNIRYLSQQSGTAFIDKLVVAGYTGLYIDRFGYTDAAQTLETEIKLILKEVPIESEDKRFACYDLRRYKQDHFRDEVKLAKLREQLNDAIDGVYVPDQWINFTDERYLVSGWSTNEGTHRWNDGHSAEIEFKLKSILPEKTMRLVIVPKLVLGHQQVEIILNETKLATPALEAMQEHTFEFKTTLLRPNSINTIKFNFPGAAAPGTGDLRCLSVALGKIGLFYKNEKTQ